MGVEAPASQPAELTRQMARKFLHLFSKAQSNSLEDSEAIQWMTIVGQVDYADFTAQWSDPVYLEGKLIRRLPEVLVEWHDGERQVVPAKVANALCLVDAGEHFSAMVKFGKDNQLLEISKVSALASDYLEIPDGWPKAS